MQPPPAKRLLNTSRDLLPAPWDMPRENCSSAGSAQNDGRKERRCGRSGGPWNVQIAIRQHQTPWRRLTSEPWIPSRPGVAAESRSQSAGLSAMSRIQALAPEASSTRACPAALPPSTHPLVSAALSLPLHSHDFRRPHLTPVILFGPGLCCCW
jgi:hypothetical protein